MRARARIHAPNSALSSHGMSAAPAGSLLSLANATSDSSPPLAASNACYASCCMRWVSRALVKRALTNWCTAELQQGFCPSLAPRMGSYPGPMSTADSLATLLTVTC